MTNESVSRDLRLDYIRIANYYYKDRLTQEEIAKNMNMSRQKINRMLNKCIEMGVVHISIESFEDAYLELENRLEKKYGLRAVRIADNVSEANIYDELGKKAAAYISKTITKGDVVGFSRGRTLSSMVEHMPSMSVSDLKVVQLMGGWNNSQARTEVEDIVHRFSEKTDGVLTVLHAPVVVNSPDFCKLIENEPYFYEAYNVIKSCTIAVVGIGDVTKDKTLPMMEENDYEYYKKQNIVGEVCAHFFDAEGKEVRTDFDDRIITVKLKDFFKIPLRVGVAGSQAKIPSILGAIKGGYINSLVTDFNTAEFLAREE